MIRHIVFTLLLLSLNCDRSRTNSTHKIRIGMIQTVSHPSLNAARDSFMAALNDQLGGNIDWLVQNADGMISHLQTIAASFHHNKDIQLFFAIGTPAALAMTRIETVRPVLVAAVTDPNQIGVGQSNHTNITGVSDAVDTMAQMSLLRDMFPDARTVALLYSTTEPNSGPVASKMDEALVRLGLRAVHVTATSDADLLATVHRAVTVAEVVAAPSDNLIAASATAVASIATRAGVPFFAGFDAAVHQGALAAWGVDYGASGRKAAHIAMRILKDGAAPHTQPIESVMAAQAYVNRHTLAALHRQIPNPVQSRVMLVGAP